MERYRQKGEGIDSRPLIHTGEMSNERLHYQVLEDRLLVGSSALYAAVQNFGAAKGEFGAYSGVSKKNGRRYSGVAPWGDIPARPFVGISEEDREEILDTITEVIMEALR